MTHAIRFSFYIACIGLNAISRCQEISGQLEGTINDWADRPLPGANVRLNSPVLQGSRGTSTDDRGTFRLEALPPGIYTVKVTHVACTPLNVEDVRIHLGKTTRLGVLQLQVKDVQVPEVVASGDRPFLDPSSTTFGAALTREFIEALPQDRTYLGIASLLPHNIQSYYGDNINVAGATGSENRYFVNGTDVTDIYKGDGGMNLPYNFIREIQVMSGGYEAQYRSALGGAVNVVTNSGSNEFSGQAFGFYTNKNLSGEQKIPESQPPTGAFSLYDFGVGLGGPIVTDRLWFFAAYNPSFRNERIHLPGLDEYPDETRIHMFAGTITWRISSTFDMTATVLGDPAQQTGIRQTFNGPVLSMANADPYLSDSFTGGHSVVLDARHSPNDFMTLEGSVSWSRRTDKHMPATSRGFSEAMFYDAERQELSGGYPERADNSSRVLTSQISVAAILDEHTLKAGLAYKEIDFGSSLIYSCIYRFPHPDLGSTYLLIDIAQIGHLCNRIPSAFIQDSWTLSDQFRLNYGLRWDGLFIIGSNGRLAQRILGQYQPRIGFVFSWGNDGADRISGSVGRYSDDLRTYGSTLYHIDGAYQYGVMYAHDPRVNPSGGDTVLGAMMSVRAEIADLRGQYFDEFMLGYEHMFAEAFKLTVRGIYRVLGDIVEDAESPPGSHQFVYANPGRPPLSDYPRATREYLAFELGVERSWGQDFNFLASYVLSHNYGNYNGLFAQEAGAAIPNAGPACDFLYMLTNGTGLLPNDRTHVFKLICSYRVGFGLSLGTSFFWASGTPLSKYSVGPAGDMDHLRFLEPRGSTGRLSSIWDLNLRVSYDLPIGSNGGFRPRCILDVFHIASQREVVQQDQLYYLDDAGTIQNQAYGEPMKFQPPMSLRLGIEVGF
jgi:hypothetical protein